MGSELDEATPWISQPVPPMRPTEIFVPVEMGITPVFAWQERRGVWGARLEVAEAEIRECDHYHETRDEAWECASSMARDLAENQLAEREWR